MDPGEFVYLLGGMLDVTAPQLTEPKAERIARKVREAHDKAHQDGIERHGRTGSW